MAVSASLESGEFLADGTASDLMTARLLMVVAISGWRAARHPDNAAYLLRNNPVSWARLAACERVGNEAATSALRRACGLD